MRLHALILALFLALPVGGVAAQEQLRIPPQILVVDPRAVLEQSEAGREVLALNQAQRVALQAEADAVSEQFEKDELELAARRPLLTREAFAELAEDFDRRVRDARSEQDAKAEDLIKEIEARERAFIEGLNPIYAEILNEIGGAAVIDLRSVILADARLNITQEVIRRLDRRSDSPSVDPEQPAE